MQISQQAFSSSKQQTILVIDDNITNLRVAIGTLEAYSYEILTARTGEVGLTRAEIAQPDLILLDIQMPGIDGFEVCRRLKANAATAAIPVLFMTVRSDTSDIVDGFQAGAVDFITKPIAAEEVLARVRTHLALRHLQERLEDEVAARTAALTEEIERRKRQQEEKERLLETVHVQSEQLRHLTRLFLETQQKHHAGIEQVVDAEVKQHLALLSSHLDTARQIVSHAPVDATLSATLNICLERSRKIIEHLQQQTNSVHQSLADAAAAQQALLANPLFELSTREREVLRLLLDGKTNSEIAEALTVARGTVSTYRRRIMDKLNVDDVEELLSIAMQYSLVPS